VLSRELVSVNVSSLVKEQMRQKPPLGLLHFPFGIRHNVQVIMTKSTEVPGAGAKSPLLRKFVYALLTFERSCETISPHP
jgi:hypothetical protein